MPNSFKNAAVRNVGTSAVAVLAVPASPATTQITVIGLTVSNLLPSKSITVEVDVFDGTNSTRIIKNALVLVGRSLVPVGGDQKLVLRPGQSLRVKSSDATSVDAVLSYLEITV